MTLVCIPFASDPKQSADTLLALELTSEAASLLLCLAHQCRSFLKVLGRQRLIDHIIGYVSIVSPIEFKIYQVNSLDLDILAQWVERGGGWSCAADPQIWEEAKMIRTVSHYLMVFESFVVISGLRKYGAQTFETRSLSFAALKEVARATPQTTTGASNCAPHDEKNRFVV